MTGLEVSVCSSQITYQIVHELILVAATYDNTGFVDYLDVFNDSGDDFEAFTILAGPYSLYKDYP
jgi:hypothetical protein